MTEVKEFYLKWKNHERTIISTFGTLLENGAFADCTLAAEGKLLKAHKVVLSACSPYFQTLLSQHYCDRNTVFVLKDVKFAELRALMNYMYRGRLILGTGQLSAFLLTAQSLQIRGLSENHRDLQQAIERLEKCENDFDEFAEELGSSVNSDEVTANGMKLRAKSNRRSALLKVKESASQQQPSSIKTTESWRIKGSSKRRRSSTRPGDISEDNPLPPRKCMRRSTATNVSKDVSARSTRSKQKASDLGE